LHAALGRQRRTAALVGAARVAGRIATFVEVRSVGRRGFYGRIQGRITAGAQRRVQGRVTRGSVGETGLGGEGAGRGLEVVRVPVVPGAAVGFARNLLTARGGEWRAAVLVLAAGIAVRVAAGNTGAGRGARGDGPRASGEHQLAPSSFPAHSVSRPRRLPKEACSLGSSRCSRRVRTACRGRRRRLRSGTPLRRCTRRWAVPRSSGTASKGRRSRCSRTADSHLRRTGR